MGPVILFRYINLKSSEGGDILRDHDSNNQIEMSLQELESEEKNDLWDLGDILELFEMWGYYPSKNPTDIEEIAQRANIAQEDIRMHAEDVNAFLLNFPKEDQNITFLTEESKRQYLDIVWNAYLFEYLENEVIKSNKTELFGHAYLYNRNDMWKDEKPAVYLSYFYQFETRQLEILEILEVKSAISDYAYRIEYKDNMQEPDLHKEEGIRLLNQVIELNPNETIFPVSELEGEELKQYVALIFLDVIREPDNIYKYEDILTEDSKSFLQSIEGYYEKPKEIYDFARIRLNTKTRGEVVITSQFQPTLWENILINIDIVFEYNAETGKISIENGTFLIEEKP